MWYLGIYFGMIMIMVNISGTYYVPFFDMSTGQYLIFTEASDNPFPITEAQRGSQHYIEKRRGRRELEVTRMR